MYTHTHTHERITLEFYENLDHSSEAQSHFGWVQHAFWSTIVLRSLTVNTFKVIIKKVGHNDSIPTQSQFSFSADKLSLLSSGFEASHNGSASKLIK